MAAQPPTVLLVDDEPSLLVLLQAAMRRAGFDVHVAHNGAEGERQALALLPDLIVCDIIMPPPDGFELRRLLADNPATREIPFVFLTARTDPAAESRAVEGRANDYITKPFDRDDLIARLWAVVRRDPQRQSDQSEGGIAGER